MVAYIERLKYRSGTAGSMLDKVMDPCYKWKPAQPYMLIELLLTQKIKTYVAVSPQVGSTY